MSGSTAVRREVYRRIDAERERQEAKHPGKTPANTILDVNRKLAIMVEEYLEAVEYLPRALLGLTRAVNDQESEDRVEEELLQVAAISVAWLEAIEVRRRLKNFRDNG